MGSTMRRVAIATTLLLACVVRLGEAQVSTGNLAGVVEDQTGGVVPGVHVQVLDAAGHVQAGTVTGRDGAFALRDVPAGPATVQAELQGFRRASASVRIVAGRVTAVPRFVLEIAGVTQEVTVGPDRTAVS